MPREVHAEKNAKFMRAAASRLKRASENLNLAAAALETKGLPFVYVLYGSTIEKNVNAVCGFADDAATAAESDRTENPDDEKGDSAPGSAPGGKKPAPVSGSAKANQSTRKRTTKKAAK